MSSTAELYRAALSLAVDRGGVLSDDTYLEKLATATGERVSSSDAHYVDWGLKDFVQQVLLSLPEQAAAEAGPLQEFALNLLLSCFRSCSSARDQSVEICSSPVANPCLFASVPGLALVERVWQHKGEREGYSWAGSQVDKVLLPAWTR